MATNDIKYTSNSTDPRNRAYDLRRDDDQFVTPTISIYDIDYAILHHLKNNLALQVEENGEMVTVPVFFSNGETWSQIQRHGYLRDKSRKVMAPVMTIRRTSMAEDDRFTKLDVPGINSHTAKVFYSRKQNNNQRDWIHKTNNSKKSYTTYVTTLADFVKVTYELYIQTELTSQLNYIVEQLIPEHRMPWGDSLKFTTALSDTSFETTNPAGSDRIVSAQLSLEVYGRILSEYSLNESVVKKAHSVKRVDFTNESEQNEFYVDQLPFAYNRPSDRSLPKKI